MANYPEDHRAKPHAIHFGVSQFFDPQARKGDIKETERGKSLDQDRWKQPEFELWRLQVYGL